MAAPLASSADVAVKLQRSLSAPEAAAADVYIREASALLRRRVAGLDTMLISGDVDPDLARGVVTEAVVRVLRNPAGVSAQTVSGGGGTETASWGASRAVGRVVITDDDVALLTPLTSDPTVGGAAIGTVTVRGPWWVETATWQEKIPPWAPAPVRPYTPGGEDL